MGSRSLTFREREEAGSGSLGTSDDRETQSAATTLLHHSRNHLGENRRPKVSVRERNAERAWRWRWQLRRGRRLIRIGPRSVRRSKAKRLFDIAGRRLACVAFAIRTILSENESVIDKRRKMAAQGPKSCHPMRAQGKKADLKRRLDRIRFAPAINTLSG